MSLEVERFFKCKWLFKL